MTCWFYIFNSELKKASEILQSINASNPNGVVLTGWIEIMKNTSTSLQQALNIFTESVEKNSSNLELLLGKCVASERLKKFTVTIDSINATIVEFPDFQPALEIKAKVLMMIGDWD